MVLSSTQSTEVPAVFTKPFTIMRQSLFPLRMFAPKMFRTDFFKLATQKGNDLLLQDARRGL